MKIIKNNLFYVLIIFSAGFLIHASMLNGRFKTLDDKASIQNNETIKNLSSIKKVFTSSFFGDKSYYRPLVSASFMVNYHLAKLDPFYYNLTNLFIHLSCAVLIFFILKGYFLPRELSFFVAFIFAVHPIHWEAVANIPGRAILLCALFVLLSFLCFLAGTRPKINKSLYFLSLLFFSLSLLSKESAVVLPGVIFTFLLFFDGRKLRSKIFLVLPFFALIILYVFLRKNLGIIEIFHLPSLKLKLLAFFTFLKSVIIHLRLIVFPFDLHFDRTLKVFSEFNQPELLLTLSFYIVSGFLLFKNRSKIPKLYWFFILWFFIELFPVSQIPGSIGTGPGYISTAEHFLYLPSIGAFSIIVLLINIFYQKNLQKHFVTQGFLKLIFFAIIFSYCLITIEQNTYAKNEISMCERTLKYSPDNLRIRTAFALGLAENGLIEDAEYHFRESLKRNPFDLRARIGLGKSLCDQGRYIEGINEYEKIPGDNMLNDLLQENLRLSYQNAIETFKQKINRDKNNKQLFYTLGVLYLKQGMPDKAIDYLEQAVTLDPYYKNALFNLASGYDALKNWEKAVVYYQRFIKISDVNDELYKIANSNLEKIYNINTKK